MNGATCCFLKEFDNFILRFVKILRFIDEYDLYITAAPFPQIGKFSISIFDKDDDSLKVVLTVTAKNSSTQWAVTAETTDTNCDEDDIVRLEDKYGRIPN